MNQCVVGLQWGDEGKGKVVDILAGRSDIVVRYGGGANAGHTVVVGDESFALHLLPSGAIRSRACCVIANGVVVDPETLLEEIDRLVERGISLKDRLLVSGNAHVVMDYHKAEDAMREESLGEGKLGTTIRGIGPCYADKVGRSYAVRMADFRDIDTLSARIRVIIDYKNRIFAALYGAEPLECGPVIERCAANAARLKPYIADTTEFLHDAIGRGKSILFEGAQGALLDIDHGTFPYVTSSNSSVLGLPAGSGVPARCVDRIIGVAKAYTTRVGAGPFPTEQDNEVGDCIRHRGNEYGTTTGRPRRCGWFDAVAVRYAVAIGAVDSIALMHLDTLSGMKELRVCRAYRIGDRQVTFFPSNATDLFAAECVYDSLEGWDEDITGAMAFDDLPEKARAYVQCVEKLTGRPVDCVGVGPKRSQAIFRR